ncbi:MAG: NAD(+)/NADH kinase [Methanomicrobiaceae archaeon]|nr:NAD(+)/NADH kinase [Methanomicrobiaceae archaeon]
MKVVLICRLDDVRALEYTRNLASFLWEEGHEVVFEEGTGTALGESGIDFSRLSGDIAAVIGGDGSVLLTIQRMERQIPVMGINWGEVGFLTDLEPEEAEEVFRRIGQEGFSVDERMRILITVDGAPLGNALNEAVIATLRPAKMLRFSVHIDGIRAEEFRSDGLLVSTPTGSTAYAMSAGGPIVDPRIAGFLLVPLAPYLLSSRPHIISTSRKLEIRLDSEKPARLVLDGQLSLELHRESVIRCTKSPDPALFVDVGRNFFEKVERKLRKL